MLKNISMVNLQGNCLDVCIKQNICSERHEQQSFEQQLLNKNMFETEQLEEKLKRLDDENKIGNEREFNSKLIVFETIYLIYSRKIGSNICEVDGWRQSLENHAEWA